MPRYDNIDFKSIVGMRYDHASTSVIGYFMNVVHKYLEPRELGTYSV